MPTAICLSGGGSHGDFQVGALRYLYDRGVRPDILTSTSVGSVNAVKLAEGEGAPTQGFAGLEAIWLSLTKNEDMFRKEDWLSDPVIKPLADTVISLLAAVPPKFPQLEGNTALADLGHALEIAFHGEVVGFTEIAGVDLFAPVVAELGWLGLGAISHVPLVGFILAAAAQDRLPSMVAELEDKKSIYNLKPIEERARTTLSYALVSRWAAGGGKLRMAMVGLVSGELRFVTETGSVVARDGVTPVFNRPADLAGQTRTTLLTGVIASSSIPVFFPPVVIGGDAYVDGGIREVAPVKAAIDLGADRIYVIEASKRAAEVMPQLLDTNLLSIGLRSLMDLAINEISVSDLPMEGDQRLPWITVIQPRVDVHDILTIHPGLIRIQMAYGYMCAADALEPPAEAARAAEIADELTILRYGASRLESWIDGQPVPPTSERLRAAADPVRLQLIGAVRDLKTRIRALIAERRGLGAVMPPIDGTWRDPLTWWGSWEAQPQPISGSPWGSRTTVGAGEHFYTVFEEERDDAIHDLGYASEGIACHVPDAPIAGSLSLFRLLNPANGDHFYTTSAPERDAAITASGYTDEGTACTVFRADSAGRMAVYRLVSPATGDHFYTADLAERDNAIRAFGYVAEGIACHAPTPNTQTLDSTNLHRLLNPVNGDHFYTTDDAERDMALQNGYRSEGEAWRVFTMPASWKIPLLRLWNPAAGDHFYTTDEAEAAFAATIGYVSEGIACYVATAPDERLPLYRCLNPASGDHFYTTSLAEHDAALFGAGFIGEGIACDVLRAPGAGAQPLYRLRKMA